MLLFGFSLGVGAFVIGLSQIPSFRMRLANRGRLFMRTPGPVPFLMLRPLFPELVMSKDLLSFEHSSVPLFCLQRVENYAVFF